MAESVVKYSYNGTEYSYIHYFSSTSDAVDCTGRSAIL